jgi:accessory Sec system glycosyltransferase GtfB
MGGRTGSGDIMMLFDDFGVDSQDLYASFRSAGYDGPAAVINDDGFLPDDVMSVYGFFLGDFKKALGADARPKYFNQITVPEYWEISGTNTNGKVQDLSHERGKIFYAQPLHRRLVKVVDWYDERGVVRSSDHYNRYGAVYARTVFNARGQRVNKSYFSATGQEIIVENYVTGDIILNDGDRVLFFRNKTEFVLHFLRRADFKQSRICYNSLSTPFFVSQRLGASAAKKDVLFWQEPVGDEIPGNMQIILRGEAGRTGTIMVQKRRSYDRLIRLGAGKDRVRKLGFIYPFARKNGHRAEALICTNSDHIEHCEELIRALPKLHFHIAALTEMSAKLMSVESYENVTLYPNVKRTILDELFEKCDYYFDINHEAEIVSAVRRAFLQNQLIFAFEETAHNQNYVAKELLYPTADAKRMISDVRAFLKNAGLMEMHLGKQRQEAMAEKPESYAGI